MVGRATSAHGSQEEEVVPSNFSGTGDDFASVFVRLARIEKFEGTQSARAAHVSTQRQFVDDLVAWNSDAS
jgi:pyridoxal/pyridoxine/pyridoxamine kinase